MDAQRLKEWRRHMYCTWAGTVVLWIVALWPASIPLPWWKYVFCAIPALSFTWLSVKEYIDYKQRVIKAVIDRMGG